MSKYNKAFNFAILPVAVNEVLLNSIDNASRGTELVYEHSGVNGDFTIAGKLSGSTVWTNIYTATGTAAGSLNIAKYDDLRITADDPITVGTLVVSAFSFSVTNVGTVVGAGDASAANQVTGNNLLTQIETNQDTQTGILNTIASNTSGSPAADIVLIDSTSTPNITYVGEAAPGSSAASAVWKITRIDSTGAVTTVLYADGNTNKDNIWNNRLSGSYS